MNTKHDEKIRETLHAHSARGYIDQFNFPQSIYEHASAASSDPGETDPDGIEFHRWLHPIIKKNKERLAREKVAVFRFNERRTFMTTVGYMTIGEASKACGVWSGELLGLDGRYGGVAIHGNHLFISDKKMIDGIRRYGPDIELGELISRLAA